MTQGLERLAQFAAAFALPEAVATDDDGFTLEADDVTLTFFAPGGESGVAYCRALVGNLEERECPADFAEAALRGNFFWRGTEGAVISLNQEEQAIYLTDRFDDGAFEDEAAFRDYINDFLRTLFDWQTRLETSLAEKEVAR